MAVSTPTARIDARWTDSCNALERGLARLTQQWNADPAMIMANLNRLISIVSLFRLHSFVGRARETNEVPSDTKEWHYALEFYMNMDGKQERSTDQRMFIGRMPLLC